MGDYVNPTRDVVKGGFELLLLPWMILDQTVNSNSTAPPPPPPPSFWQLVFLAFVEWAFSGVAIAVLITVLLSFVTKRPIVYFYGITMGLFVLAVYVYICVLTMYTTSEPVVVITTILIYILSGSLSMIRLVLPIWWNVLIHMKRIVVVHCRAVKTLFMEISKNVEDEKQD